MIKAAPSPAFARCHSTVVSDSNLRCHAGGDTLWCQASVFAISTFFVYGVRPVPSLRRQKHPFSQSALLEVMVHGGYNNLRMSRSASVRPPA
jgi:hypothetical protein